MNIVSVYLAERFKEKIYIKLSESLLYNLTKCIIYQLIKSLYSFKQSK